MPTIRFYAPHGATSPFQPTIGPAIEIVDGILEADSNLACELLRAGFTPATEDAFGLGDGSIITVGKGGRFSDIQAAINFVQTLPQFEAVTGIGTSPTVTSWAQHSDELTVTGLSGQVQLGRENYWFTHASLNGRLYPVEALLGVLGTKMISAMRRIEATFSGAEAITFYRPIIRTIQLMPGANYDEDVTFSVPVCVRIVGDGVSKHNGSISFTTDVTHGIFIAEEVNSGELSKINPSLGLGVSNTIAFLLNECVQSGINDGWFSPSANVGSLKIVGGEARMTPGIGLGHFIVLNGCRGDLIVHGMRGDIDPQNLSGADFRLIDNSASTYARKVVAEKVHLDVHDNDGTMAKVAIFAKANAETMAAIDCTINYICDAVSVCELAIAHDDIDGAQNGAGVVMVDGCGITASVTHAGQKYAFKANKTGSANNVIVSRCGSLRATKPSAGTLSVLGQGLGVGSTGGGSASLGANCPAVTVSAPNTWKSVTLDDGTTGYVPVWK